MRPRVARIPFLVFLSPCLLVFRSMSSSTLSDFEDDLYGSSVSSLSSLPFPAFASAIANAAATPEAMKAPQKRLFAPFELDQIYRAWGLWLRPVRTRPCVPCGPYSGWAPVSPPLPSTVEEVVLTDTRWPCDAETVVVCEKAPLVAWNESAEDCLLSAYFQWKVETARQKAAEEALWRRSLEPVAIVTPESFETCRVDPVSADQSLLSHVRLWEPGTFHFTPVAVGRSPTVYLGLQERFVDMRPGDVDLCKCGVDLTRPFTICETPRAYTVTQDDLVCELSRIGLIHGVQYVERQQVPLSISFADLSFEVRFEAPPSA